MKGVEKIYKGKKLIAIIFRNYIKVDGLNFFTENDNFFQIGAHNRKKGLKLKPHIHNVEEPLIINKVQEWILVQEGKIRVTLYTKKGDVIIKKILSRGDSILLIDEGHGVDFVEDSKLFEIKQGPFPKDGINAKIFFN